MRLAYYSKKDGTFHEKVYGDREQCKKDYNILKRSGLPFCYDAPNYWGPGLCDNHGILHGKETSLSELPILIADKFEKLIEEDIACDYGGKKECMWRVYRAEYWYSIIIDLGEDMFENEVVHEYFITKDGESTYAR